MDVKEKRGRGFVMGRDCDFSSGLKIGKMLE